MAVAVIMTHVCELVCEVKKSYVIRHMQRMRPKEPLLGLGVTSCVI